jgi:hypothetical protein
MEHKTVVARVFTTHRMRPVVVGLVSQKQLRCAAKVSGNTPYFKNKSDVLQIEAKHPVSQMCCPGKKKNSLSQKQIRCASKI